jgi:hypothetical protein
LSINGEGLLHQLHPEQRLWRAGKFPDADFNFTQRSEYGQVLLAHENCSSTWCAIRWCSATHSRSRNDPIDSHYNPAVAIVGHYLLFVIASTSRPSAGRFIQICCVGSRAKPWLDEEWWEWLGDRLAQHHQLDPADLRRLRRDRAESPPPLGVKKLECHHR